MPVDNPENSVIIRESVLNRKKFTQMLDFFISIKYCLICFYSPIPLGSVTVAVKLPDKAGQLNFIITDPPDPA